MESRFSIGDIAKIHNVSVQTLRHYDKIGLLTPSYINKETGYRYYSSKDFVIIDLIKQCKSMGLSLDEIKEIIHNYTSLESILDIMKKQKDIIDKKISELNTIKNNISFLEKRINDSLEEGIDRIFIKEYPKREFIKYDNTNRFTVEFEINLSKALADAERKYNNFNKELAFVTSFEDLENDDKTIYKAMMLSFTDMLNVNDKEKYIIPEGKYITINFDDDYKDTRKYYARIMNYIRENNLKIKGDFYEIYAMTRVGNDGKEKSLGKLQIAVL
ncbi:MerR family transcriptional regulator [Clostridium sp. NSJ-6]|uniref:MerR family transcriptional regulator n=1 Tax=Clostridium hominis TaxID=2763036 RepID=A0ABR7DC25_9CLOT|nr:MerR family transcriptional regulator [Clostridium hominis]MBC5628897.1 MerR family transcriptional regulator [Clostridium hominis]